MPTYDYECKSCSHTFEAFQSISEAPLSSCPECGGPVRRLIGGGTGIIFKGSGFYVNDSRKSGSGSVSSSSPKPAADPAPAAPTTAAPAAAPAATPKADAGSSASTAASA